MEMKRDLFITATVRTIMMRGATSAGGSGSELPAKRRKVKHETYQKWVRQYDRDFQTVMWLDCETGIEGGYNTNKENIH